MANGLKRDGAQTVEVVFADGSIHTLRVAIASEAFKGWLTRNGGEVVEREIRQVVFRVALVLLLDSVIVFVGPF